MAYPLAITLLFLISPIFSLIFILHGLFTSKKYAFWFGFLLAVAIGLFVYSLIPDSDMDLYRYYIRLDTLSKYTTGGALADIWSQGDPITYTFMYIVSSIFSKNFVPLIFSIIGYSILFYVILDYRKTFLKKYDWRTSLIIFFVLAVVIVFNTLTGLRFALALTIFILALYLDLFRNKKVLSKVLYVFSPLIHSSMILIIALRVGAWLLKRFPLVFYVSAGLIGSASSLILVFSTQLSQLPFLTHVGERAVDYLAPDIPPGLLYPFAIATSLLILLVIWMTREKNKPTSILVRMTIATVIISLVNINQFVIGFRFATIAKYLFILVLLEIVMNYYKDGVVKGPLWKQALVILPLIVIILGSLAYQVIAFTGVNAQFTWDFPDVFLENVFQILGNK
jgi:hypothetical protein